MATALTPEQREKNAERARVWRASMSPEQKAAIRERENAARRVRVKTPEQIEREKAYQKIYRASHKKEISEANRALYLEKKAEIKVYQTNYYAENKAEMLRKNQARRKARSKQYAPARSAQGHRRRVKRRAGRVDQKGILAWMKQIRKLPFVRCHWCGTKVNGKDVHFDHVVAVALGGSETIGNYCASCQDCNLKKHARALSDWICNGQTFLPI